MKKHIVLLISLLCPAFATAFSQDTTAINPLDSVDDYSDTIFFEQTISLLDAQLCARDTIITEQSDSVYLARLQMLPYVVEMPYNQMVGLYINRYINKHSKQLARIQSRALYYTPIFVDILSQYDIPYELCYLPIIESALNPCAHSRAGAVGLWQFMPSTGRLYGLEINSLVDERMDVLRSTDAACRFLATLYGIFEDWNLAIAAYNCGAGNVRKAILRAGGKRDFWSIYPFLPRETRNYLPLYIATAYAMSYADMHGISCTDVDIEDLMYFTDTIHTDRRQHLEQISSVLNIPIDQLRQLNPQYTKDILPGGKQYTLCLPSNKTLEYISLQDSVCAYKSDSLISNRRSEIDLAHRSNPNGGYSVNGVTYYKIRKGDTLGGIAKKFHVTVKQLRAWNNLKNDNIREGKTLKIGK